MTDAFTNDLMEFLRDPESKGGKGSTTRLVALLFALAVIGAVFANKSPEVIATLVVGGVGSLLSRTKAETEPAAAAP